MDNYFYPVMWIHVFQNFNVKNIYLEMLEVASGAPCHEFRSLNTLQMKLEEQLRCKRFFIVLDDIWAVKDGIVLDLEKTGSATFSTEDC